jgi:hypothetical protein
MISATIDMGQGSAVRSRADWLALLQESLVQLAVEDAGRFFAVGLARDVARCCPRLEVLTLGLGFMHNALDSDVAASLAELLRALPGLRSLTIGEAWLSTEVLRALAGMSHLAHLSLRCVDSATEGLEALGRGMVSLESLSVYHSFDDRLGAMIRGMVAAPRLASLHVTVSRSSFGTSPCARLAAAFASCGDFSGSSITDLALTGDYTIDHAEELDVLLATLAPLRGLRILSLSRFQPLLDPSASRQAMLAVFAPLFARMATFPALERLSLDVLLGQWVRPEGEDARLTALIATTAAAAPRLGIIHTGRVSHEPLRLADLPPGTNPFLIDPLPSTEAQAKHVEAQRLLQSGGPAWEVVAAGVAAKQERRIAGAGAGVRGLTIAETLPTSVMRDVAAFLDRPVPLLVS